MREEGERAKDNDARCADVTRARRYLQYHLKKVLKKKLDKKTVERTKDWTLEVERAEFEHLFDVVGLECTPDVAALLSKFLLKDAPADVYLSWARLLYLMSGDSAISNVFPFQFHEHLLGVCDSLEKGHYADFALQEMKKYGVEIAEVLCTATDENLALSLAFIRGLVSQVKDLHSCDRPTQGISQIPGSYNPAGGSAYYFHKHGEQLRTLPTYGKDTDKETVQDPCEKSFPKVSYGGFGYMFLFFCPIHGHCYGFHLIDGGEGRKDAFAPLYKFKESPPKDLFFDFACQLNEYCLNREPEFFKFTRFWHDLFHSVNHTCGQCFKSARVCGMAGIDSEICEQFNSYLQCIKYTGSHLSLPHFMLFTQFMISLWNEKKTIRYKKRASIALRGML